MKRGELKKKQIENYELTKKMVNDFLKKYDRYNALEYSFLWATYNLLSNGKKYFPGKTNPFSTNVKLKKKHAKYFIVFGSVPEKIIKKFRLKGFEDVRLEISNFPIGLPIENRLIFSRKGRVFHNDPEISKDDDLKMYKEIIEDNYFDLKRFENTLDDHFGSFKPSFVILDEDRTKFKRVCVEYFKKKNVKTFIFQHGLTPIDKDNKIPLMNESFVPLIADHFICWGKNSFDFMKNFTSVDNLIIGGNPIYDFHRNFQEKEIDLLFIDQQFIGFEEEFYTAYEEILRYLENNGLDYKIYLRGKYNFNFLKQIVKKGKIIKWKKNGLSYYLQKSKISAGFYSTGLLESLINFRPIMVYDHLDRGNFLGFKNENIAKLFKDEEEFIRFYRMLDESRFNDEEFIGEVKNFVEYFGDESAKIICEKILERL